MTHIQLTERSRSNLRIQAESMRLHAWRLQEALNANEIDPEEALKRLNAVITIAKDMDRKIKARRRAAQIPYRVKGGVTEI